MAEKKQKSGLREFFSYFKPHMGLFLMDMACATLASLIDLAFPYVSRMSMTTLLPERMFTTFFVVIAIMIAAYVLKGVFTFMAVAFAIAIIALWIWGQETARRSVEDTSAAPQK